MNRSSPAPSHRQAARPPGAAGQARQLQVWGHAGPERRPLWRTFLTEQRAPLRELSGLEDAVPSVRAPVLLLADPNDPLVPVDTALRLARALPDARLQLVEGAGHHLPRRIPDARQALGSANYRARREAAVSSRRVAAEYALVHRLPPGG
jgi:pimeloyl-ACP methyl ester carboxylesterase